MLIVVVRLIIMGCGFLFLLISMAGAILTIARGGSGTVKAMGVGPAANPLAGVTKLIEAVITLLKTLGSAPLWLGTAGVGIVLIILGALLPLLL